MTQSLAVDSKNDLVLKANGLLDMATGQSACMYACANAAKGQLGEMVLQIKKGLPNFKVLWVGAPNVGVWKSYLRKAILAVDGVVGISSLTVSLSNNVLSYEVYIKTIYGDTYLNG